MAVLAAVLAVLAVLAMDHPRHSSHGRRAERRKATKVQMLFKTHRFSLYFSTTLTTGRHLAAKRLKNGWQRQNHQFHGESGRRDALLSFMMISIRRQPLPANSTYAEVLITRFKIIALLVVVLFEQTLKSF